MTNRSGENSVENTLNNLLLAILFALLGLILLIGGYRVFDVMTPTDLNAKIFEEGNIAAAVLAGAFIIGLAVVVAAAIHG